MDVLKPLLTRYVLNFVQKDIDIPTVRQTRKQLTKYINSRAHLETICSQQNTIDETIVIKRAMHYCDQILQPFDFSSFTKTCQAAKQSRRSGYREDTRAIKTHYRDLIQTEKTSLDNMKHDLRKFSNRFWLVENKSATVPWLSWFIQKYRTNMRQSLKCEYQEFLHATTLGEAKRKLIYLKKEIVPLVRSFQQKSSVFVEQVKEQHDAQYTPSLLNSNLIPFDAIDEQVMLANCSQSFQQFDEMIENQSVQQQIAAYDDAITLVISDKKSTIQRLQNELDTVLQEYSSTFQGIELEILQENLQQLDLFGTSSIDSISIPDSMSELVQYLLVKRLLHMIQDLR